LSSLLVTIEKKVYICIFLTKLCVSTLNPVAFHLAVEIFLGGWALLLLALGLASLFKRSSLRFAAAQLLLLGFAGIFFTKTL
jgi:hypothetical protein